MIGCVGAVIEAELIPSVGSWIGLAEAMPILRLLAVCLPLQLLIVPATARLDRDLKFGSSALIDMSSHALNYVVAIPLALNSWGAWSLAVAWVLQRTFACVLSYVAAGWLPRPTWDRAALQRMLVYVLGFSVSTWIWKAKSLVNPMIVGSMLGVEAVGYVNLAIRIVEVLSFVKNLAWRISIVGFSRLEAQRSKIPAALSEGAELQVLAAGIPLMLFSSAGSYLIAKFLGRNWLPAFDVYPFVAVAALVNSLFALHSSALFVQKRAWDVVLFNAAHVALFSVSAYLLLPHFAIRGYGYAELIAIGSYVVIDIRVRREIGAVSYSLSFPWCVSFALAILVAPSFPWVAALPAILLARPGVFHRLLDHARLLVARR